MNGGTRTSNIASGRKDDDDENGFQERYGTMQQFHEGREMRVLEAMMGESE